jgi:hypothetical protein
VGVPPPEPPCPVLAAGTGKLNLKEPPPPGDDKPPPFCPNASTNEVGAAVELPPGSVKVKEGAAALLSLSSFAPSSFASDSSLASSHLASLCFKPSAPRQDPSWRNEEIPLKAGRAKDALGKHTHSLSTAPPFLPM